MIETERLLLRKPRLDDATGVAEYLSDPEVMRFIGGVDPEHEASEVVCQWLERWEANGFGHFVVERREDGRFLGRAGLVVWDTQSWRNTTLREAGEHAQPELGWTLVREHWGNGYATEAVQAVRYWADHELALERLISLIHPDNVRSIPVAERLGAQPTETVTLDSGVAVVVWVHPR